MKVRLQDASKFSTVQYSTLLQTILYSGGTYPFPIPAVQEQLIKPSRQSALFYAHEDECFDFPSPSLLAGPILHPCHITRTGLYEYSLSLIFLFMQIDPFPASRG